VIPTVRRVLTLDGSGRIGLMEQLLPDPGPGELLVANRACCISPGTELGSVPARRSNPDPSVAARPLGYSSAGEVIAAGPGCEEVAPGTRVACMGAGYALHATHAVVPYNLAVAIPEGVSFEAAATNHLASTALHAVRRGDFTLGEHVAVCGLGILGYFCAQVAALSGAHVLGLDPFPLRRERTLLSGAVEAARDPGDADLLFFAASFSRGHGFDGGIIAFGGDGSPAARLITSMLKEAPDTHRMGRIVVVGGARIDQHYAAALGNVDIRSSARPGPGYHDQSWEHGHDYPATLVPWTTRRNIEECLRWMALGRLDAESCTTHRVPLSEGSDICDLLISRPQEALGVILLPDG